MNAPRRIVIVRRPDAPPKPSAAKSVRPRPPSAGAPEAPREAPRRKGKRGGAGPPAPPSRTPAALAAAKKPVPPKPPEPEERSVLDLIIEIRGGAVHPKLLSPADRAACVAHLCAEGLTVPEIAQFLKCSDRTITRDRGAIQEGAALQRDPAFAGQMAGQLLTGAMLSIERIRRVSRERATPATVKVDAEHKCFEILSGLTQRLQSLGYLPTAAQRLEADVTQHGHAVPGFDQIRMEIDRLTELGASVFQGDQTKLAQLQEISAETYRAELATRVALTVAANPALAEESAA